MKLVKHYIILAIIAFLILLSLGCEKQDNFSNSREEVKTESQISVRNEEHSKNNEDVVWEEVNEYGIDEVLLIKNVDEETLTYIAEQLQDICIEIDKKGKNYCFTTRWYSDIVNSKQYKNVTLLDKKAMKPLFLIICKSEHAGMYEWACSKALEEISGFDFSRKNNGAGWTDSKEF